MKQLNFSYNWNNKLECKAFTTLRLSDRFEKGEVVEILLKKEKQFEATVVGKQAMKLDQINDFVAYLDTGYDAKECQFILMRMYKYKNVNWQKQLIYFYLLERIKDENKNKSVN